MSRRKSILFILGFFVLLVLIGCSRKPKYTYFGPSLEFYINDKADAFLRYTQWNIYINGESLYEESLVDKFIPENIKGAQVVVLTQDINAPSIDTTRLFNEWGIGKNNMGILLVLYFSTDNELPEFVSITSNIGLGMMGYLSVFELNDMIDTHFFPELENSNYELATLVLYHEIIGFIYTEIYGYTSYTYNYDTFVERLYDMMEPLPSENSLNRGLFGLVLFNDFPLWLFILIVLFIPTLGYIGFSITGKSRGGGGRSIGYWFNRRK